MTLTSLDARPEASAEPLPAQGAQESILTLDQPAMVRLGARSSGGTRCEVVDHIRGPFAQAGTTGKHNCELDLLLDAGIDKAVRGREKPSDHVPVWIELDA